MKFFIVAALFVAAAVAIPVEPKDAVIVKYLNENYGLEGYKYDVETSDGKSAAESGQLKNVGTDNEALEVQGQYSYPGPDGVQYAVTYVANEFGFQPQGAHLPVAP